MRDILAKMNSIFRTHLTLVDVFRRVDKDDRIQHHKHRVNPMKEFLEKGKDEETRGENLTEIKSIENHTFIGT